MLAQMLMSATQRTESFHQIRVGTMSPTQAKTATAWKCRSTRGSRKTFTGLPDFPGAPPLPARIVQDESANHACTDHAHREVYLLFRLAVPLPQAHSVAVRITLRVAGVRTQTPVPLVQECVFADLQGAAFGRGGELRSPLWTCHVPHHRVAVSLAAFGPEFEP